MYGSKLEKVRSGRPGVKSIWLLPIVATEITTEKPKLKKREKRHCNIERIKKFYNIVKMASKPLGGIMKSDLSEIMGYKNKNIPAQGIESLNSLFELETSIRPLKVDKSHKFINLDIIQVDNIAAELIMEDLLEKLEGVEPKEPRLEYESIVKSIIKSDYYTLKMFEGKSKLEYRNGDVMNLRKGITGDCKITITGNPNSMEDVVKTYTDYIFKRYSVEISMYVKPRQYVQVSSQDELKEALKKIEDKYAEFFCEDIVPHERTVLASEIKKETEPSTEEEDIIRLVESVIFKNESGNLFISQIWEKLDLIHVERHWDILGVLRKCPRFSIKNISGESGIEPCVYYTAPEPISDETNKNLEEASEEGSLSKEEVIEIEDDFKPSTKKNESSTTEIYFGFQDEGDLNEICQKAPECEHIDDDGAYHMCVFYANSDMDKKTILLLLKLCYMAMSSEKVKMIYHNKNLLIKKLEHDLLN
jgi:hypothetical protein